MSRAPRKFEPGPPFADAAEVAGWCRFGNYVFAFGTRPIHGSFIMGQRLSTVVALLDRGRIRRAHIRREWHEWTMERSKVA